MPTVVTIAPGHQLAPAPAASYARMRAAGCPSGITSSYRSSSEQAHLRALYLAGKGAFALPPGSSQHEIGYALDLKSTAAAWVRAHPEFGWRFTNPAEWWHVDYFPVLDVAAARAGGGAMATPSTPTTQEDVMDAQQEQALHARLTNIEAILTSEAGGGIRGEVARIRPDIATVHQAVIADQGGAPQIDYTALAQALGPILAALPALSDADVDRIADSTADRFSTRLAQ